MPDTLQPESADPLELLPMCGRCYDGPLPGGLYPADCGERPELRTSLGMYHCPDCGAMLLGGMPHPELCRPCLTRSHPRFDAHVGSDPA